MPITQHQEKLANWQQARFAPAPEGALNPISPSKVERVPMRDGIHLYTEIFLPFNQAGSSFPGDKKSPVILTRSPYPYSRPSRHNRHAIDRFLKEGYAYVFQLTRGQGASEGTFRMFFDDSNDGFDTIQWIAEQVWCNGNVGMLGPSYLGNTQLLAARARPPALKCIMPTAFVGNATRCYPFSYGVPQKGTFLHWLQMVDAERRDDMELATCNRNALEHPVWGAALRHRPLVDASDTVLPKDKQTVWREAMSHPEDDDYWREVHFTDEELSALDLPIFFTDGWYDMTIGPIDFFSRLETLAPNRDDRYLLVGPWNHYQTFSSSKPGDDDGDRILPDNGSIDFLALRIAFFDRYLKGNQTAKVQEDRVRVFITGINRWFNYPTYPVPGMRQLSLYLKSDGNANVCLDDGELSWNIPNDANACVCDRYAYDPDLPTYSVVETFTDRRETEIRTDVLTYTSAPFKGPLTLLGEVHLILHAASDAPDTDWFAIVTEVFPDGQSKSFHYAPPAFRARYRQGLAQEVFLMPNKPEEFYIPMGPAGHQIAAGNRLRLSIFSSAFPEFEPNRNTGNTAAADLASRRANQTVYHDKRRPSRLVMSIVDL